MSRAEVLPLPLRGGARRRKYALLFSSPAGVHLVVVGRLSTPRWGKPRDAQIARAQESFEEGKQDTRAHSWRRVLHGRQPACQGPYLPRSAIINAFDAEPGLPVPGLPAACLPACLACLACAWSACAWPELNPFFWKKKGFVWFCSQAGLPRSASLPACLPVCLPRGLAGRLRDLAGGGSTGAVSGMAVPCWLSWNCYALLLGWWPVCM